MTKQEEGKHERIGILANPELVKRVEEYAQSIDSDTSKLARRLFADKLIAEGWATPEEELHKL